MIRDIGISVLGILIVTFLFLEVAFRLVCKGKITFWNGEGWYVDQRGPWKRFRQVLIWVGGWEKANGAGWNFPLWRPVNRIRLRTPFPLKILSATFYSWGMHISTKHGYVCWTWKQGNYCYISPDATPAAARCWIWGRHWEYTPEIERQIADREAHYARLDEQYATRLKEKVG